jgi:hypothetical protein
MTSSFDEPPHVTSETNIFFKITEKNKEKHPNKMNVWYHLSTIFSQRRILQIAGLLTLCVALITTLFFNVVVNAQTGVNQTISFQGRLLTPQGQPVTDGYYNIEFKIYQDGDGTEAGNPEGTLEWFETHTNNGGNNGVYVKNGYMSVNLGSKTPFGNDVDWNQDTLWLSMNIAGSSTLCTTFGTAPCLDDGEMLPMKRLTSTPYALNAGKLGGISADGFIQNTTSQQTGNFNITGTGMANILQGTSSVVTPLLDSGSGGTLSIGTTNASVIDIGSSSGDQTIDIGTGSGDNTLTIGSTSGTSSVTIQGGTNGVSIASSGGFTVQGSEVDALAIETNGTVSIGLAEDATFAVKDSNGQAVLTINESGDTLFTKDVYSQSAIGVYSPDEASSTSITTSDNGTGTLGTTGNKIELQGGAVPLALLTAVNNNGTANIGIGNAASSGYALDVTGKINSSDEYLINGVSVLNSSGLNFSGAGPSSINAAEGEALQLTGDGGVKIGDGDDTGEPTLLTLDQGATTPTATGDAVLGSMYYDTTLGKVQCYEADGWGSCSSSPDNFITLSPEYTNAVTNGTGVGDFSSDICSDALNINDGSSSQPLICNTNETFNFYKWTTDEESAQTKDIYVTYQLPSNFTGFVSGSTSLVGRTDDDAASVSYQVYKNTASGLVACGTSVTVSTGEKDAWQKATATGSSDPALCTFASGNSLVFKISLSSEFTVQQTNAYASTLSFAFSNN